VCRRQRPRPSPNDTAPLGQTDSGTSFTSDTGSHLFPVASIDPSTELLESEIERDADTVEDADGGLLLPNLDEGDEWAVEFTAARQIFLGEAQLASTRLYFDRKRINEELISAGAHLRESCECVH